MPITTYIHPTAFFVTLCIGIFYVYITTPQPIVVIKYPTPDNAGKIKYVDDAGVCYKYSLEPVSCPADKGSIKHVPVQQH